MRIHTCLDVINKPDVYHILIYIETLIT